MTIRKQILSVDLADACTCKCMSCFTKVPVLMRCVYQACKRICVYIFDHDKLSTTTKFPHKEQRYLRSQSLVIYIHMIFKGSLCVYVLEQWYRINMVIHPFQVQVDPWTWAWAEVSINTYIIRTLPLHCIFIPRFKYINMFTCSKKRDEILQSSLLQKWCNAFILTVLCITTNFPVTVS